MHFEDLEVNECTVNSSDLAAGGCEHLNQTPVLNSYRKNPIVLPHGLGKKQNVLFLEITNATALSPHHEVKMMTLIAQCSI